MEPSQRHVWVEAVHATPTMLVLAVTGGGMAAVTDLLLVPGASRTVLEVTVPYAETALTSMTGDAGSAVSLETAGAMAAAAYERALALRPAEDVPVVGVACTAALVTDRERRGSDRACVAWVDANGTKADEFVLEKAAAGQAGRARAAQDRAVADQLLRIIVAATGASVDSEAPE